MNKANPEPTANVRQKLQLDQPSAPGRRRKRWLVWGTLLLLVIILPVLWNTTRNRGEPQYQTQNVRRGNLTVVVTATGNLEPTNQVTVGTEVSGTIATVTVDDNDPVKIGQILAKLDTTKLTAQIHQSRAALAATQAKVQEAQATVQECRHELARLQRVHQISGGKVPSRHDLDAQEAKLQRALAAEASSHAAVAEAEANLAINETDLTKAEIHSPINGIVLERAIDPGQTVASSLQAPVLFTLAEDLTRMELHVAVDEADVGQVTEGQEAIFSVDAYPDRNFPARITLVRYGSQQVDGVTTYETVLEVDNAALWLRPGMTATADITVQRVEDVLLVPNAALRFTPPVQQKQNSSSGSLIGSLFRRPASKAKERKTIAGDQTQQQVWLLREGQLEPVSVTTGVSDGIMTELVAGNIEVGTALVTDILNSGQ